jgi:hypothetical protein
MVEPAGERVGRLSMRDVSSAKTSADTAPLSRVSLLRRCAVAVAAMSFMLPRVHADAQTLDPVAQRIAHLTDDGTLSQANPSAPQFDRRADAKMVADRISDLSLHPASRADVETLRELIFALKDELDAANVRIDDLQGRLDAQDATRSAAPPHSLEHLGSPLDPLSSMNLSQGSVAARLWGYTASHSLSLIEARTALDTLEGSAVVGSSLLQTDRGLAQTDVTRALFSVASTGEVRFPQIRASVPGRVVAQTLPPVPHSALRVALGPAPIMRSVSGLVGHVQSLPLVQAAVQQTPHATIAYPKRAETFSEGIVTNAAFERALHSAGASSGSLGGKNLFAYPETVASRLPTLGTAHSMAYQSYLPGNGRIIAGLASMPLKLGHARVTTKANLRHVDQGMTDANPARSADSHGRYDAASVSTSIVVPAFHKNVTINVGGGYDRLHRPDTTTLPYYPYDTSVANYDAANVSAGGDAGDTTGSISTAAKAPDTERYTYGAGAAVPVAHNVHLGIGYTSQHLSGTYGAAPGAPPVNRKDAYSGSVTYAPHGGKSSVTLVGRQYRYSDDAVANSAYTETRGDVMFSVKF